MSRPLLKCVTGNVTEKISLLKREIAKLQREIDGADHYSDAQYIRDFLREFRSYLRPSCPEELDTEIAASDLILIGDYHALPQSQLFQAELLERLAAKGERMVLCVEMVYSQNQRALDRWLAGQMKEKEFLARIRYDSEWGYDWSSFKKVFEVARQHGIPIFGIDSPPRNDLRYIHRRDRSIAAKIVEIAAQNSGCRVLVAIGESHLASRHLPAKIARMLQEQGVQKKTLVILQNVDDIFWKLSCEGKEDSTVVQLSDGKFCVFNASPFRKYEAYFQLLQRWQSEEVDEEEVDLTSTLYSLIDAVLEFVKINKHTFRLSQEGLRGKAMVDAFPEIYSLHNLENFRGALRHAGFSKREMNDLLHHVRQKGSCYIPRLNAIYLGQFNLVHGAEEAAHFVHFACKGELLAGFHRRRRFRHDLFYIQVLEEALAYFGSKLIEPGRSHFRESLFWNHEVDGKRHSVAVSGLSWRDFQFIGRFLALHKDLEARSSRYSEVPAEILQGIQSCGKKYHYLIHELGYLLGEQIYDGYLQGEISRDEIRKMFFQRFEESGSALKTYLKLAERLAPCSMEPEAAARA
ncbi:MAG: ChaN family lipoprotein [Acidobacteria bacterium]|nr:ChaN family lipoprotein [Acidobacteriota bacterium]